jgi:UDP-N-acetylmuramyl pentapeptide phosphotransferase/UDP-N-acetylglucosamine-1-phosphate transferase
VGGLLAAIAIILKQVKQFHLISILSGFNQLFQNTIKTFTVIMSTVRFVETSQMVTGETEIVTYEKFTIIPRYSSACRKHSSRGRMLRE